MPRVNASGSVGLEVDGLAELNRALRDLGGREFQNELKEAGREAAEGVADEAEGRFRALGALGAKVAPTVAAKGFNLGGGVSFGGARAPMAGGVEFGAERDRKRLRRNPDGSPGTYVGYRQFQEWRGSGSNAGYALYPTIRDQAQDIAERYADSVNRIVERHGLK